MAHPGPVTTDTVLINDILKKVNGIHRRFPELPPFFSTVFLVNLGHTLFKTRCGMPPFRELAPHPTVFLSITATDAPDSASTLAVLRPV